MAGDALADSDATWNVIAQQTIMSRITVPLGSAEGLNLDQWDGYPAARRRLVEQIGVVDNPVVITGDIHASGVGVVTVDPDDPTTAPLAAELVGTSVSSTFPPDLVALVEDAAAASPTIRYVEPRQRGYVICEVTAASLEGPSATCRPPRARGPGVDRARWVVAAGDPEPRPAYHRPPPASWHSRLRLLTRVRRVSIRIGRVLTTRVSSSATEATHMALQPLDDRIVVKPGESEETTGAAWSSPTPPGEAAAGEVLAVGPGSARAERRDHSRRRQRRRHSPVQQVRRHRGLGGRRRRSRPVRP